MAASAAHKKQKEKVLKKIHLSEIASEAAKMRKKQNINSYIDYIWNKYDADSSNSLEVGEVQSMIIDYVNKELPLDMCVALIQSICPAEDEESESNSEEDIVIDRASFSKFVSNGILMTEKEIEDYKSRSPFHQILSDWFAALQHEAEKFSKHHKINANSLFRTKILKEAAAIARQRQDLRRQKKLINENITKAVQHRSEGQGSPRKFL